MSEFDSLENDKHYENIVVFVSTNSVSFVVRLSVWLTNENWLH